MERVVDILSGILTGLLVGLVAVILGMIGGSTPDTSNPCVGLMVTPPVVGGLCGGFVSWRRGREPPPGRRRR